MKNLKFFELIFKVGEKKVKINWHAILALNFIMIGFDNVVELKT